ncbi:hypothetical protein D3C84_1025300 [compost metagenome]
MPFVLIEDVVDDLLLGVTHQIVILTAFAQMHFSAIVATVIEFLGAHATPGKRRREVAAHLHLIDKRVFITVTDFQADAVVDRLWMRDHLQALLDEYRRDLFNCRTHRRIEKAIHLVPRREVHRLTQALTPATAP